MAATEKITFNIILVAAVFGMAFNSQAQTNITIDAASIENSINHFIYGSCIEDVNHEIYGGLYDQKIFGESFEEDSPGMLFKDFEHYGGNWHGNENQVAVSADAGAKLVSKIQLNDGNVSVELKFDTYSEVAGLILRVSQPSIGADDFNGYEVSLNPKTQRILLGKHQYNWQAIKEAPVNFIPGEWNRLRAELTGNQIRLFLNDETIPVIDYTDNNAPLLSGTVGIRTFNSDVSFRNLKIGNENVSFQSIGYVSTNFPGFEMFEGNWSGIASEVTVGSADGAKLIHETELTDGSVEVEMKFSNPRESAALIVRVEHPEIGADNFDGYEIGLNADRREIILGKHVHNWLSLGNTSADFIPENWNRLRVELAGARIRVYLNDSPDPIVDYTDTNAPRLSGKIGVRTWRSNVSFRNLRIHNGYEWINLPFAGIVNQSGQWDLIRENSLALFSKDNNNPFNGKYSQKIDYPAGNGKAGLINGGLNRWGIAVQTGQEFQGRIYLRSANFTGPVYVALQSADGQTIYAVQEINGVGNSWTKFPFSLTANATDTNARFAVWMQNTGALWVDQVVLEGTGEERFHGLPYRADIGHTMVGEGLTFLRYGGTMVNSPEYRFKKMIGDPDMRPPYRGHWYPFSTNGFGIEDFLKFCEAAGFEPAFAINIEETAEDAADMVEYLNGDITTEWGAKRALHGHPEPYRVKYIEIGNEEVLFEGDNTDGYVHYIERFLDLYNAMIAKDPNLQIINAAWWRPESSNMQTVFTALNGKAAYWDFHPWTDEANSGRQIESDLKQMQKLFLQWDPNTTMKCAIFEENGNLHNMQRALGHATTLNAVRRMGDFVLTSCAANALQPYKQNDNGWDQGQIFFTPSQVWAMPPYYAQQMASLNHLPLRVKSTSVTSLDMTATRDENNQTLVIHTVNVSGINRNATISLQNFNFNGNAQVWTLSGNLNGENTPEEPEKLMQKESRLSIKKSEFSYIFPPYSYTIIRIERDDNLDIQAKEKEKSNITQLKDAFVLTYPEDVKSISIYDISGHQCGYLVPDVSHTSIFPTCGLTEGCYLFKFSGEITDETVKVWHNK